MYDMPLQRTLMRRNLFQNTGLKPQNCVLERGKKQKQATACDPGQERCHLGFGCTPNIFERGSFQETNPNKFMMEVLRK